VHRVEAPLAPLALYRRYRPETFAEVIGQDHVTEPLRHALAGNRVHHAYLFSGPRGCGKTTSARILARTLNCERAPVAEPCGQCQSCRDLARQGPGSLDVIEIDAASHGGVEDARDLRERAFFTPVSSRYKVYVIDEAHMVTPQGFNALLKLVEEPPAHLKFIFATTEPDKVIGTIRSRTHHYPFRLVPPRLLTDYLLAICAREGAAVDPLALPLVVRAGGGSVRDTLSVLDQLIGGAGAEGVTYPLAAGLLGYTPDWLLDEVIDAFAAADGASVFAAVDKVVETGQDPRRFAEDLLQRLRDLIIVASVPDAAGSGVLPVSADLAERLEGQAARFGAADLTRSAEVVSAGLDEIRGATAPRLLLELICARVLLPGADASAAGVQARLDRLERRFAISTEPGISTSGSQDSPVKESLATQTDGPPARQAETAPDGRPAAAHPAPAPGTAPPPAEGPASAGADPGAAAPGATAPSSRPTAGAAALGLAEVRHSWPDILNHLSGVRRLAWMLLSRDSHVISVEGATMTVSLPNAGARDSFSRCGGEELLRQSLIDVLGVDWMVETVVEPAGGESESAHRPAAVPPAFPAHDPVESRPPEPTPGGASSAPTTKRVDPSAQADSGAAGPPSADDAARQASTAGEAAVAWPDPVPLGGAPTDASPEPEPEPEPEPRAADRTPDGPLPRRSSEARAAIRPTRAVGAAPAPAAGPDTEARPDDPDLDDDGLQGADLLASRLGAQVIEEIPHSP
jgi:DNA polymerase-3 subunit gamma/tau